MEELSLPVRVDAAPELRLAAVVRVAAAGKVERRPVAGWLIGLHGGAADPEREEAADRKARVADELGVEVPLVVRLQGTKSVEGREILAQSNLNITPAETLKEAGELAVAAVKGAA